MIDLLETHPVSASYIYGYISYIRATAQFHCFGYFIIESTIFSNNLHREIHFS
jgi:hypothetical protein